MFTTDIFLRRNANKKQSGFYTNILVALEIVNNLKGS